MKNLNLTFYAFAGISSMPVTLLAGQFQPEKKSIFQSLQDLRIFLIYYFFLFVVIR